MGFFTRPILIGPLKLKVIKNNKELRIFNCQVLTKFGHKMLIANPIEMFVVEIPLRVFCINEKVVETFS